MNQKIDIQLNNEILKNKQLQEKIEILNKTINNQQNQIANLNSKLQNYINENKYLNSKIKELNNIINNNIEINNEINNLKNENIILKDKLNLKEKQISNLNLKKNVDFNDIIVVNFRSTDSSINTGIKCLGDETFAEVEERLYQQYDEFRNTNNKFLFDGKLILRFKKIKENKIINGAQIILDTDEN